MLAALLMSSPALLLSLLSQTSGDVTSDPEQLARLILDGITSKNYWLAVVPVVTLLVWALRTYGPKMFPKLEGFLTHPVVSFCLPIVTAILGGLITAAIAGPMSGTVVLGVILAALKVGAGSISAYVGAKKVGEARDLKAEAAAKVDSVDKALDTLNGPKP